MFHKLVAAFFKMTDLPNNHKMAQLDRVDATKISCWKTIKIEDKIINIVCCNILFFYVVIFTLFKQCLVFNLSSFLINRAKRRKEMLLHLQLTCHRRENTGLCIYSICFLKLSTVHLLQPQILHFDICSVICNSWLYFCHFNPFAFL